MRRARTPQGKATYGRSCIFGGRLRRRLDSFPSLDGGDRAHCRWGCGFCETHGGEADLHEFHQDPKPRQCLSRTSKKRSGRSASQSAFQSATRTKQTRLRRQEGCVRACAGISWVGSLRSPPLHRKSASGRRRSRRRKSWRPWWPSRKRSSRPLLTAWQGSPARRWASFFHCGIAASPGRTGNRDGELHNLGSSLRKSTRLR
eukprot:scaffold301_cov243-Pinguiococcus_pyrenoidosus.AAC.15